MCKSICTSGQTLIVLKKTNLLCYQTLGTSTAPENIQREELKITVINLFQRFIIIYTKKLIQ